jgi:tripartite ATP-independent transporter DctM subunit
LSWLAEALDILMFVALCAALMAGFPVAFTLAGTGLLFGLIGQGLGVFDFAFIAAFPQRIYGTMTNEVLIAVPLFIFMGVMLERSKVAEDLLETMGRLFGPVRGGLGFSVTIVGAILAASTGIVGATVVTMGLLSLPTMLRWGYSPRLATGTIAAAGTLGQIIPPSIVLVVLGDQLAIAYQQAQLQLGNFAPDTVSVGDLFAGALIPGLGLVVLYLLYQIAMAIFRPETSPPMPPDPDGAGLGVGALLRGLLPPFALIITVLGSILAGIATPTEAAALGAGGSILLAGHRLRRDRPIPIYVAVASGIGLLLLTTFMDLRLRRLVIPLHEEIAIIAAFILCGGFVYGLAVSLWRTFRDRSVLVPVLNSTAQITSMVFVILIGAALFSLVFRGLGGEQMVKALLGDLPGGALGAIAAVMLLMFLLGFFIDFLEIVFIVVPLVAPVLLTLEFAGAPMDPVWLGIMMGVNLQTSFLTPPFGFALFYLRGVAPPSVRTLDIYRGAVPFVAMQVLMLLVLWFVPSLATWLPQQLYD